MYRITIEPLSQSQATQILSELRPWQNQCRLEAVQEQELPPTPAMDPSPVHLSEDDVRAKGFGTQSWEGDVRE